MLHPQRFAITLAAWQEQGDADTRFGLDMLHAQARQLIATKTPPKAQQQQRAIAPCAAQGGQVVILTGLAGFLFETGDRRLQVLQQQRRCLLGRGRVQATNAAQHLAHQGALVGSGKPWATCHWLSAASRWRRVLTACWSACSAR